MNGSAVHEAAVEQAKNILYWVAGILGALGVGLAIWSLTTMRDDFQGLRADVKQLTSVMSDLNGQMREVRSDWRQVLENTGDIRDLRALVVGLQTDMAVLKELNGK